MILLLLYMYEIDHLSNAWMNVTNEYTEDSISDFNR